MRITLCSSYLMYLNSTIALPHLKVWSIAMPFVLLILKGELHWLATVVQYLWITFKSQAQCPFGKRLKLHGASSLVYECTTRVFIDRSNSTGIASRRFAFKHKQFLNEFCLKG